MNSDVQRSNALMSSQYPAMKTKLTFLILICCLLFLPALVLAQVRPPAPSQDATNMRERPLTEIEEELRAKQAIKHAEKDHQETLDRAKEIAQLGSELKTAVNATPILSRESQKKIERLEKLTRKIRGDAGGDDQEVEIANRPTDVPSVLTKIAEAAETLSKEVQNTPRQVISVSTIERANVLLELIKIMRTLARQP